MQRKKLFFAILLGALLVGTGIAAVMQYYGKIVTTATVEQAITLDGHKYDEPVEHTFNVYGGCCVCRQHYLKNRGCDPIEVTAQTTVNGHVNTPATTGVKAMVKRKIYETFTEEDFSAQLFEVTVTKTWECYDMVWTVDMSGIEGHWSTGVQLIICNSFILGWSPGENTEHPIYKPYIDGGWGVATTTLPSGMSVSGNYNEEHYVITVPVGYLGGCCATFHWAMNVEASWPGHSASEQQNYPANWQRWTDTNCAENQVGTPVSFPYTLEPNEILHFCICYWFNPKITPGTYKIATTFS